MAQKIRLGCELLFVAATYAVAFGTLQLYPDVAVPVRRVPDDGVLREPGLYRLTSDLVTDRPIAVTIAADGIDLDLGGFAIRGNAPVGPDTFGVRLAERSDVTVRNGSIDGFRYGVHVLSSRNVSVTDLTMPTISNVGILVSDSTDVRIARNEFGGLRHDVERETTPSTIAAVLVRADGFVVEDNRFQAENTGEAFDPGTVKTVAILCSAGTGVRGEIRNNDLEAARPLASSYAVLIGADAQVTVRDNVMRNFQFGIACAARARVDAIENRIGLDFAPSFACTGIHFSTDGTGRVSANEIRETHSGIVLAGGFDGIVTGNLIETANAGLPSTAGETIGIQVLAPTGVRVEQNRIRNASRPTRGPSDAFGANDTE